MTTRPATSHSGCSYHVHQSHVRWPSLGDFVPPFSLQKTLWMQLKLEGESRPSAVSEGTSQSTKLLHSSSSNHARNKGLATSLLMFHLVCGMGFQFFVGDLQVYSSVSLTDLSFHFQSKTTALVGGNNSIFQTPTWRFPFRHRATPSHPFETGISPFTKTIQR